MDRMGALMGSGVGLTIGFIFGSYSILRCVVRLCCMLFLLTSDVEAEQALGVSSLPCHNTC